MRERAAPTASNQVNFIQNPKRNRPPSRVWARRGGGGGGRREGGDGKRQGARHCCYDCPDLQESKGRPARHAPLAARLRTRVTKSKKEQAPIQGPGKKRKQRRRAQAHSPTGGELSLGGGSDAVRRWVVHGRGVGRERGTGRVECVGYLEAGGAALGWASSGGGRVERSRKRVYGDLRVRRASARRRSEAEARRWRAMRMMEMSMQRGEQLECQTGRRGRAWRVQASGNIKCH